MSKLIDKLKAAPLNQVTTDGWVSVDKHLSDDNIIEMGTLFQYKVGVTLSYTAHIRKVSDLEYVEKDFKKIFINNIYGEFREILTDLRAALYERDPQKAKDLLNVLERLMYDSGNN